jgi:hypothetical protein
MSLDNRSLDNSDEENTYLYTSHQACEPGPGTVESLRVNDENSVDDAHKRADDTRREYRYQQVSLTSGYPETPKHV